MDLNNKPKIRGIAGVCFILFHPNNVNAANTYGCDAGVNSTGDCLTINKTDTAIDCNFNKTGEYCNDPGISISISIPNCLNVKIMNCIIPIEQYSVEVKCNG